MAVHAVRFSKHRALAANIHLRTRTDIGAIVRIRFRRVVAPEETAATERPRSQVMPTMCNLKRSIQNRATSNLTCV